MTAGALFLAAALLAPTNAAPVAVGAGTNALAVARAALRDGLWDVARSEAARVQGDEARLVFLEALAREGRWTDVRAALDRWPDAAGEDFTAYRAAAFLKTGDGDSAVRVLSGVSFAKEANRRLAARIRAEAAIRKGDARGALKELMREGGSDAETRLVMATALEKTGDANGATNVWREIAAATNAVDRLRATAVLKLGDAALLAETYASVRDAALRREVGLRYGEVLLGSKATFAEGEKLLRAIVRDAPDAEGARAAHLFLADALLRTERWDDAARAYAEALETWPKSVSDPLVQEGRGWAFLKLGRADEALAAFRQAEACAKEPSAKAHAGVKVGDALAELGRGDEALVKYREVMKAHPDTPAARRIRRVVELKEAEGRGRAYYKDYRFADARALFEKIGAADPARRETMELFAVKCLYGEGRDAEAETRARRLIAEASGPVRRETSLWLAKFSYNRARWSEAAKLFLSFADQAPDSAEAPGALVWAARAAFAEGDFAGAIQTVSRLSARHPASPARTEGMIVQGEALIEQSRFDEAVLVLERAALAEGISEQDRLRAKVLRADALFAMGADNPVRYQEALEAYRDLRQSETLTPTLRLELSFKVARTLEKLKRVEESLEQYYAQVVLAYREGRHRGESYEDAARALFSRAAFRLADEYESRGRDTQAVGVLRLVADSDVPAAEEAHRRIARLQSKGKFL